MEFDKKTILAFVLIGLILIITSSEWYRKQAVPPGAGEVTPGQIDTSRYAQPETLAFSNRTTPKASGEVQPETRSEPEPKAATGQQTGEFAALTTRRGTPITVDTELYHATFNTRGGALTEWTLKKYTRFDSNLVQLIAPDDNSNLAVLIPTVEDTIDTSPFAFEVDKSRLRLDKTRKQGQLNFRLDLGNGRVIEKRLMFRNDKYSFALRVRLLQFGSIVRDFKYLVKWDSGLLPTERDINHDMRYAKAYVLTKGDLISQSVGKTEAVNHPALWAAARTKYFAVVMIPRGQEAIGVDVWGHETQIGNDQTLKEYSFALEMPLVRKEAVSDSFTVYLGPLDYRILKGYDVGLQKMMNFGWSVIRPISIGVLLALQAFHKVIPNYGVVLILFSLAIKVLIYPLTKKSYQSMKHMQQLQPKLAELKEKYANDPQKLNRETMKLYKEHGVNPLGGCLPTVLQMPLLYALFIVFQSTIELRGAGFFGWIKDLSAPDTIAHLPFSLPFYGNNVNVLPLVMGGTMLVQQKMTMQDPKQKAMVYLMPIMFMFLFNNFPSGLTLYYTMFNLFTIVQQRLIKDVEPSKAVEAPSPGQKRRRRAEKLKK